MTKPLNNDSHEIENNGKTKVFFLQINVVMCTEEYENYQNITTMTRKTEILIKMSTKIHKHMHSR